jgi:hypothetical protein
MTQEVQEYLDYILPKGYSLQIIKVDKNKSNSSRNANNSSRPV